MSNQLTIFIKRVICFLKRKNKLFVLGLIDNFKSTYNTKYDFHFQSLNIFPELISSDVIPNEILNLYLNHYFDILGSGWVKIQHGRSYKGLEGYKYRPKNPCQVSRNPGFPISGINYSNSKASKEIWAIIDKQYCPIDWQVDFKSGYRWNEKTHYLQIKHGHKVGVDIKLPWELSRMYHLPQFAIAYQASNIKVDKEKYLNEFCNETLDFIATNPPRYGVNWACSMEIAIRSVNLLIAYDIFISSGAAFTDAFKQIFKNSIAQHGIHLVNNLEWNNGKRSNHYLANIVGILFIAAHFPSEGYWRHWYFFAKRELINEVDYQFLDDGGSFEGSTAYHRLSAEMVLYATALIIGVNYNFTRDSDVISTFPNWFFKKLTRIVYFAQCIITNRGNLLQIGDNDSGRLLKFSPKYLSCKVAQARQQYSNLNNYYELPDDNIYFIEDHLDNKSILAAGMSLLDKNVVFHETNKIILQGQYLDYKIIKVLSNSTHIELNTTSTFSETNHFTNIHDTQTFHTQAFKYMNKATKLCRVTKYLLPKIINTNEIEIFQFPHFGLYIFKHPELFLSVRCYSGANNCNDSHFHNDQLSIELEILNEIIICDPGSYIYTPLIEKRNSYRSINAHFTPWNFLAKEPSSLDDNIFLLRNIVPAKVLFFNNIGFWGKWTINNNDFQRLIFFAEDTVNVIDISPQLYTNNISKIRFSPGYGALIANSNS